MTRQLDISGAGIDESCLVPFNGLKGATNKMIALWQLLTNTF